MNFGSFCPLCELFKRKLFCFRWPLVHKALSNPCLVQSNDLIEAILSYNRTDRWNFDGLKLFLDDHLEDEEKSAFYLQILPAMCKLAKELPQALTKPMPLLQKGKCEKISQQTVPEKITLNILEMAFSCFL